MILQHAEGYIRLNLPSSLAALDAKPIFEYSIRTLTPTPSPAPAWAKAPLSPAR